MPICICQTGKLVRCRNSAKEKGICGMHSKASQGQKIVAYFQVDPDWTGKISANIPAGVGEAIPRICVYRSATNEWEILGDNPRTFTRVPITAAKPAEAEGVIIVKKTKKKAPAPLPPPPKTPKPGLFLNDAQPTHRKSIVESVVKSIDKLKSVVTLNGVDEQFALFREMLYKLRYYSFTPMTDKIAGDRGKALDMLVYYSSGTPVFDIGGVTTTIEANDLDAYKITSFELALMVYKRAKGLAAIITEKEPTDEALIKKRDEMFSEFLTRFTQELNESRGMCAAGRITRIINTLSGFDPDVLVGVSPSEMMQSRMTVILASAEKHGARGSPEFNAHALELVYKALVESGMPEPEWEPWVMEFVG